MKPKDRVVELRRVPASELHPNPENWRRHDAEQIAGLRSVLDEIGFADVALAVERGRGKSKRLVLVDGHARSEEVDSDYLVPTIVLDLDDDEARLLLSTLDPLAAMATTDHAALAALLSNLETENEDLGTLLVHISDEIWPENIFEEDEEGRYVRKVESPIYEPTGPAPKVVDLLDRTVTDRLRSEIETSELPDDVRRFLLAAAERHTVFRFDRIANFYAHAEADVQRLIEASALVIVDFERAIEDGFVRLNADVEEQFKADYPDA